MCRNYVCVAATLQREALLAIEHGSACALKDDDGRLEKRARTAECGFVVVLDWTP